MKQGLTGIENQLFGTIQGTNPEPPKMPQDDPQGMETPENPLTPTRGSAKRPPADSGTSSKPEKGDPSRRFKARNWKAQQENCRSKRRYDDKRAALTALNQIMRSHRRHRPEGLRAYPCPVCRGWHLTKHA